MSKLGQAALLIIDVQQAIDADYHAAEGPRNNLQAEQRIAALLATWRHYKRPVIHIRHDSTFPASAYRPGQAGNEFKDEVAPAAGETIIPKRTNSAFIGTGLDSELQHTRSAVHSGKAHCALSLGASRPANRIRGRPRCFTRLHPPARQFPGGAEGGVAEVTRMKPQNKARGAFAAPGCLEYELSHILRGRRSVLCATRCKGNANR